MSCGCFINIVIQAIILLVELSFFGVFIQNNVSQSAVATCISAIKVNIAIYGLPVMTFQDRRVAEFQRSLAIKKQLATTIKKI